MSDDLIFLVLAAAILAAGYKVWQVSLDACEAANRIARETCSWAVVQLLDETVAFAGFRLTRDSRGRRRLLRTYSFDYTHDGFDVPRVLSSSRANGSARWAWQALLRDRQPQHRPSHPLQPLRRGPHAGGIGAARCRCGCRGIGPDRP